MRSPAERAAIRLGHGGQGTPHGWTPQGKRILSRHAKGRIKNCLICRRSLITTKGTMRKVPYCAGTVYVDTLEPALTYKVGSCAIPIPDSDLSLLREKRELEATWEFSWPQRRTADCNDLFYERYYRAWHITVRIVNRRDAGCQACGGVRGPFEYDHICEVAAGGDPLDPENVQKLCVPCHRRKTKAFARRRWRVPSGKPARVTPIEAFA